MDLDSWYYGLIWRTNLIEKCCW